MLAAARIGFVCAVAFSLAGCTVDFGQIENQSLRLEIYDQGRAIQDCQIQPGTVMRGQFQRLIKRIEDGWAWELPATHVPKVLITGQGFGLNFTGERVHYNSGSLQYRRAISKADYAFLRCQ